ncbi:uncharacterized protein EAE98_005896 [Botrytis deweyae]|uniref:Uncharacterized protein n=1 Tax=Botrytis deweyae TaxID=2478750 RepID=A0ABQ7ILA2_9HELO|nr:uncharacterized protein EAE98_005896 [Botrytis deweyae]KAF7927514.1 hypothetical protein EAE98_005896 [Botrytis deweyae]
MDLIIKNNKVTLILRTSLTFETEHIPLAPMSQSSYFDLETVSFTPPPPPTHPPEASETRPKIADSSNIQTSITTVSNSPSKLPREPSIPQFPLYDRFPQEIKCEIMYQAALQSKPRFIRVDIHSRLLSPKTRRRSDRIDAFLQAGGKWKIQEGDFEYLTITRGCGWHSRDQLMIDQFYFRPEKDILLFSEEVLENYQNINIYPSGCVKRLAINIQDLEMLLTLYKGHIQLDPPNHSTLFIGKLRNLEYIYVLPHSVSRNATYIEYYVLADSDLPSTFDRNILLMWWVSWLSKESDKIGWNPPKISFKEFRWAGLSEE